MLALIVRNALLLGLALAACGDNLTPGGTGPISIVVLDRQTDWIHPSNPVAVQALVDMGSANGWTVATSDSDSYIRDATLYGVDVVVFSVTSGDILDDEARLALGAFFQRGGGFVGIHSPSHTEWDWPFYLEKVVPVTFLTHPFPMNVLSGQLIVEDPADPIVGELPNPWSHADEFYTFSQRPEDIPGLHIQLALDEDHVVDYPDADRVGYHPITFSHELDGGRAFYTALGHTPESYSEPLFLQMIQRGIEWAAYRR
jgi:type 1 glutamine amidotransferase